ncbi:Uncharacterised protein [uncultured archaeon]|nr:Uncharacterised protein [uncultured archaeon]
MAERLIVVDKERLDYEGLFETKGLFDVMKQWATDKGYWLIEKKHGETTKPEGKVIDFDLEPFKKFTDYAKSIIKIRMQFTDIKDAVVERDGKKVKLQEGKMIMIVDGILETDYEHRWESKPVFYVLRTIFEKYLYTPFISGFERGVKEDVMALKNNVKAFLNLTRYA